MFYEQISMNNVTKWLVKHVYGTVHTDYFEKYDILRVTIEKGNHFYIQTYDGFGAKIHKGISSSTIASLIYQDYKESLIKETLAHFIK